MSFVAVEKPRPHITLVTLNRPERMNAMDAEHYEEAARLRDLIRQKEATDESG